MVDGMGKLASALAEYTDQKVRSVAKRKEVSDVLAKVGDAMKKASEEVDRVAREVQDKIEEERRRRKERSR